MECELSLEERAEWFGVSLEGYKDVWYVIKRYRVRTKAWFMWPALMSVTFILVIVYCMIPKTSNANECVAPCVWLLMFSTFCQMLNWIKNRLLEKWRHLYDFIPCHEREVVDQTLTYLTPMQITEKVIKNFTPLDSGADIIAAGYKTCHIPTQEAMGYTLEVCMQT